ncbi:hypothetical protein OG705_29770 [Streptomyces sp. NBC_00838]|uniref:hypothetical protein n=1 Tax=Streptomyces sp. NBC_00838 TaxID=2903680 RepID=UPI00386BB70D|nr:hypothetical protein OG705_29770 [Streptomyces sp. NBC_00838]
MGTPARDDERNSGTGDAARSPLATVLPQGRLRAGTAASAGGDMPLLLALAAQTADGTCGWAAVGLPQLGALAAESAGLDLARGMRIDHPGDRWGQVLAIALEAVPVVLVGALGPVNSQTGRRLGAVLRRSGSILLAADRWDGAEVRLRVVTAAWNGVGQGHGLLRGRRVTVVATGRGAADTPRHAEMWLPGPDGRAAPVQDLDAHTPGASPADDTFLRRRRASLHRAG